MRVSRYQQLMQTESCMCGDTYLLSLPSGRVFLVYSLFLLLRFLQWPALKRVRYVVRSTGANTPLTDIPATEVEGTFRVNGSNKRMRDLQAEFEAAPRVRMHRTSSCGLQR